jgi:predicted transcriptional regulator
MMGRLESTIMDILWAGGECNVHDVVGRIDRPLAYTTVMNTLDRLYKKGMLDRRKVERAFYYSPRWTKPEWERKRAGEFLNSFLSAPDPSRDLLFSCLVDVVSEQDVALLDDLERKIRKKRRELDRERKS